MKSYVIDVNVPIVANGKTPHADLDCEEACINMLLEIQEKGCVLLDDKRLIFSEYVRHLSPRGQPGVGDAFMHWLNENQGILTRCKFIAINFVGNSRTDFAEYPDDPALAAFHRKDRKYIAVAAAAADKKPTILNAVDSDYCDYQKELKSNGITVKQLCPQCCKGKSAKTRNN